MSDIDTLTLEDALAHKVGSKHAGWVMELLTREPDLVLAWLKETGRLHRTGLAYVEARPGYKWATTDTERRDVPAGAVRATADTPASRYLWRIT